MLGCAEALPQHDVGKLEARFVKVNGSHINGFSRGHKAPALRSRRAKKTARSGGKDSRLSSECSVKFSKNLLRVFLREKPVAKKSSKRKTTSTK
jgi:hypothetical protein